MTENTFTPNPYANTFPLAILGADGTVVFGHGVGGIHGHVNAIGDDYIELETSTGVHIIPTSKIIYFRHSNAS